jgi:ribosomal protein S27E
MSILPPIDTDSASVVELKVPFKKPAPEDRLLLVEWGKCQHFGPFVVDHKAAEVTCKGCGEKLNPMWVLQMLAGEETKWHESFKRYQAEMRRLSERSRTKCQHCGQMTRISHT